MREKEKVILRLYSVIKDRIKNNAENSYVNSLHKAGINKISEKLGEEAVETIIAILAKQKKDIVHESADLLFMLLIALAETEELYPFDSDREWQEV